jgi:putative transcriptional regulator
LLDALYRRVANGSPVVGVAPGSACKAPLTPAPMESRLDIVMKNLVRELRTAEGLSQGDLGIELGVSRQTINAIETGRYLPSLPLAIALARFFATTVEQVFDTDEGERSR